MAKADKSLPLLTRMFLRTRSSIEVDGLWIGALFDKGLDRVVAAVNLIHDHDRLQYRRVVNNLDRIIITVLGTGVVAQYSTRLDACEMDERWVTDEATSLQLLASAIVHEATHARLERLGFKYAEDRRRRIEDICIGRELAFVAHLPDGAAARASIEERQRFDLTDTGFAQRRETGEVDAIRYLDIPAWLLPILFGIASTINAARRLRYRIFG